MRPVPGMLLLLVVAGSATAQSHFGDVTIRSHADRIIVDVDTTLDASAPSDGITDQSFVLQTEVPLVPPISVQLSRALVVQSERSLRVTTADQRYEFVLDAPPSGTAMPVVGIAHHVGGHLIHLSGHAECDSGGPGATSCKVTARGNHCDVACASGYYACASVRKNVASCQCLRNE